MITRTGALGSASWAANTVHITSADPITALAGVSLERFTILVLNDADSTGDLYVTPGGANKGGGLRLAPGAGVELTTTAAVHAYAPTGAVTVYVVETSGVMC